MVARWSPQTAGLSGAAQAQLTFAPARAGSLQIGRQRPLKFFFRKRSAVAEETEAQLPIADDGASALRIALFAGKRLRNCIVDDRVGPQALVGTGAAGEQRIHRDDCRRECEIAKTLSQRLPP